MNYSTIKKAVVFSLVAVLGLTGISNAQDAASTSASSSAKVFGGRGQYRTWNVGLNAGALAPIVAIGGTNDFNSWELSLGYGFTVRKQLGHAFGLEASYLRGNVKGHNEDLNDNRIAVNGRTEFETNLQHSATMMGVANVATVDFLKRENSVNFLVKAGYGIAWYHTILDGRNFKGTYGPKIPRTNNNGKAQIFPLGAGVKFKVSERVNFDLGYNMYFVDTDRFDQVAARPESKDKYSYSYAGVEFSLGSTAKPSLDWVNPVALMYDELKDPTLRQEVEALKGRVSVLEAQDLLKDSDGDGVADKLDKCPGTEAGVKVDGSGCPLDVDADGIPDSKDACPTVKGTAQYNGCPPPTEMSAMTGSAIQFEFDSSVLRTDAYPMLDKLSSDLRSNSSARVQLDGHASSEGTTEYNMTLSRDRANSVKTYLVNSGVAASRISTTAFGESRPVASNATEEGRMQNRRVEFRM